eukprot:CAMPEP_0198647254 /NCGR_PEP_ID=MMETSP1467-20131203/2570_1 /TAXON_ID=1462469 /ORGANISM="unid. sp., Strain CCMP2135" /LENGTH=89 /DNA_ID=CAMNT_0044382871 /DNA_START=318 /DNA_END=584 /DNA_ORIENTATION=-
MRRRQGDAHTKKDPTCTRRDQVGSTTCMAYVPMRGTVFTRTRTTSSPRPLATTPTTAPRTAASWTAAATPTTSQHPNACSRRDQKKSKA